MTTQSPRPARLAGLPAAVGAALLIVALVIPLVSSSYSNSLLTQAWLWSIAAIGLNFVTGYLGLISVGHSALVAIGAYCTGIAVVKLDVPLLVTIPLAALVAGLVGAAVGATAIRLRGLYLALVTLALAVGVPAIISRATNLTGGPSGLNLPYPSGETVFGLAIDQQRYYLALILLVALIALGRRVTSRTFRVVLLATRDNSISATSMGVNTNRLKVVYFALSAAYAGIAGALYANTLGFISPDSFPILLSVYLLAAVIVGGLGSITGNVLGGLFIVYLPIYASDWNPALATIIYGVVLILIIGTAPSGIAGAIQAAYGRISTRFGLAGPAPWWSTGWTPHPEAVPDETGPPDGSRSLRAGQVSSTPNRVALPVPNNVADAAARPSQKEQE